MLQIRKEEIGPQSFSFFQLRLHKHAIYVGVIEKFGDSCLGHLAGKLCST